MPAYFIAQITIEDPDTYQAYPAGFMPIFDRHGGQLLTVSSKPIDVVEGNWDGEGVVVLAFPDLDAARAWKNDPDYVALAEIRKRSAKTNMILVDGL